MYISHKDTNSKYIIKINTISSYFMYMCDSRIITYMYVYTYLGLSTYMYIVYTYRPHDTIHHPFWGLAGITGANGSSWN